ncbi:MAG: hypothetical protein PHZ25_01650 [Candidatus Pacebacteria bacterium]|nr:hypothetical protein [Candidatus Paceibacterota bacterium]
MGALMALSVGESYAEDFVKDLYWSTFYLQHRGPEFAGLATRDRKGSLKVEVCKGSFRYNFEGKLKDFYGPIGIGHISALNPEPVHIGTTFSSTFPEAMIGYVGSIENEKELRKKLKEEGIIFKEKDCTADLLGMLIASSGWEKEKTTEENFLKGLQRVNQETKGSFAIAILTHEQIFIACSPDGRQTIVLGEKKGAIIAASESTGFYNQGFKIKRDLEAGEVIMLRDGEEKRIGILPLAKRKFAGPCVFKLVYTAGPSAIIYGKLAADVRFNLGICLAKRDVDAGFIPDRVAPVSGSGLYGSFGYLNYFLLMANQGKINKIPFFDQPVVKYSHSQRSFTPADPEKRKEEAHKKQIPIQSSRYHGLIVVAVDDSIVTGLQSSSDLVPKFFACGFKEVHFRITYPQIVSICCYGKANKDKKKLAALSGERVRTEEEMAEILGVNSCHFNKINDLAWAVGLPIGQFCCDCAKL